MSSDKSIFKYESASVMVTPLEDRYWVSHLYSIVPRKGHAKALMTTLIAWADQNQVVLELEAKQYGNAHGLSTSALKIFYERFGFIGESKSMIRNPISQEKHVL